MRERVNERGREPKNKKKKKQNKVEDVKNSSEGKIFKKILYKIFLFFFNIVITLSRNIPNDIEAMHLQKNIYKKKIVLN